MFASFCLPKKLAIFFDINVWFPIVSSFKFKVSPLLSDFLIKLIIGFSLTYGFILDACIMSSSENEASLKDIESFAFSRRASALCSCSLVYCFSNSVYYWLWSTRIGPTLWCLNYSASGVTSLWWKNDGWLVTYTPSSILSIYSCSAITPLSTIILAFCRCSSSIISTLYDSSMSPVFCILFIFIFILQYLTNTTW